MRYNKEQILSVLNLTPTGSGKWNDGRCVLCGKEDHMGVTFDGNRPPSFRCFKCGKTGSLAFLLKHIGRSDLIKGSLGRSTKTVSELSLNKSKLNDLDTIPKEITALPRGYRRVSSCEYLESRGFSERQFDMFGVATATEDIRYGNDYVLFTVYDDGKIVGVLGRSKWSPVEIKEYNKRIKEKGKGRKHVKYKNLSAEFSKMLFGHDEIIEGITDTVILVEGVTDKANVDRIFSLYDGDFVKCCCTFGKDISQEQIAKLVKKGVKSVILFYDPDALQTVINKIVKLHTHFDSVKSAIIRSDNDPGDMGSDEMEECLTSLEDCLTIKFRAIDKNKLNIKR